MQKCNHKLNYYSWRIISVINIFVLTLTSCVGQNAISPDGQWVTTLEQNGTPTRRILQLRNTQTGDSNTLSDDVNDITPGLNETDTFTTTLRFSLESSFSPDSRYVLYLKNQDWMLSEVSKLQPIKIAEQIEDALFLPNNELLIVSSKDGLKQIFVADPKKPLDRSLRVDKIAFSFTSFPQNLTFSFNRGELTVATILIGFNSIVGGGDVLDSIFNSRFEQCPSPEPGNLTSSMLLIDSSNKVYLFRANANDISVTQLGTETANTVYTFIKEKVILPSILFATIEGAAQQTFNNQSDISKSEEFDKVIVRISRTYPSITLQTIFSADGTKILFRSLDFLGKTTIYLVDLSSGKDPFPLSFETPWSPRVVFSPDSKQILFESNRDGERAFYIANSDGTNIHRVPLDNIDGGCWY